MAQNGPPKITVEDFIRFFEQHHAVPDHEDQPFFLNYETKEEEGASDFKKYNEDRFSFCCILTTKRLLRHAIDGQVIHVDTTHKMNWEGFPVHLFGISDRCRKFHLIAIGFSSQETSEQFEFCFRTIKDGVADLFDHKLNFQALMSDAAGAIKNGFEAIFPYALKITCWFHVEEAIRKRKLNDARNKDLIMKDLRILRLSSNAEIFNVGTKLFINKWSNVEKEFTKYFSDQWLSPMNMFWFAGAMQFAPTTNNCLESTNDKIKTNFSFRTRCKMNVFQTKILQVVRVLSTEYRDKVKEVKRDVSIRNSIWKAGESWAKSGKLPICNENIDPKSFYVYHGTEDKIERSDLKTYKQRSWMTFLHFSKNIFKIWCISIPDGKDNFRNSTCTCPCFLKFFACKHVLGLGIRLHLTKLPPNLKTVERKPRRPGRPKRIGPALSRD